jgi:hypothetical protein
MLEDVAADVIEGSADAISDFPSMLRRRSPHSVICGNFSGENRRQAL